MSPLPKPRTTGLGVFLYVTSPERSAAFYRGLGFTRVAHDPALDVHTFRLGRSTFLLGRLQPFEPEHIQRWVGTRPWGAGACLMPQCASADAVHDAAKAIGAEVLEPPTDQPWGARTVTIRDPDGYLLMFDQPARKRKAKAPAKAQAKARTAPRRRARPARTRRRA